MIGAQLFGLRNDYAKNRMGILCALKEMGYEAVEPMASVASPKSSWNPSTWTLSSLKECFAETQEVGLAVPSVHMDLGLFRKSAEKLASTICQINMETNISIFVFSGMFSTEKNAEKWGRLLRKVSDGVKDAGCMVLYHNHDMEFHAVSSKMLLDIFFEYAGPDVGLQLDIGWAGMAWDEMEAVNKYADRIVEIHCKDFFGGRDQYTSFKMPREMFAPIGEGIIKTEEIIRMSNSLPRFNGAIIIDQDASAGGLMEDMQIGLRNLRRMEA